MPKVSSYSGEPISNKTHDKQVPKHERQYLCPVDGCVFVCAVSSILLRHKRKVHTPPVACDMCNYTTSDLHNLKRHKKVRHSTLNPKDDFRLPGDQYNFKDDFDLQCNLKDDFDLQCNLKDDFGLPGDQYNFKDDFGLPGDQYNLGDLSCDMCTPDYWWLDYLLN